MNGDTFRRGACGRRERGAPREVRIVQQTGPIDGAYDNRRLFRVEQDVTNRFESVVDGNCRFNPAAEEGVSQRWRYVEAERGDGETRARGDFRFRIYDL